MLKKSARSYVVASVVFASIFAFAVAEFFDGSHRVSTLFALTALGVVAGIIASRIYFVHLADKSQDELDLGFHPDAGFYRVSAVFVGLAVIVGADAGHIFMSTMREQAAIHVRSEQLAVAAAASAALAAQAEASAAEIAAVEALRKSQTDSIAAATALLEQKRRHVQDSEAPDASQLTWLDAKSALGRIAWNQPTFAAAQALIVEMAEEEKLAAEHQAKVDAFAAAAAKALAPDLRKVFARDLEQSFLDDGKDISVSASGPKNTVLTIKWVLVSRVTANELKNEPRLLYRAGELGFKKVVISNGYDFAWSWTL